MIEIDDDNSSGINIESVFINDESGYRYILDTFCLTDDDFQIGIYSSDSNQSCKDFDTSLNEYDEICIDSNECGDNIRLGIDFGENLFDDDEHCTKI